jgi:hypothetical protein
LLVAVSERKQGNNWVDNVELQADDCVRSRWKVVHQPIPSPYHPTCFGPVIHSVHIEPAEAEGCETQTSQPLLLVGYNWRLQTIQYRVFQPIGILGTPQQASI